MKNRPKTSHVPVKIHQETPIDDVPKDVKPSRPKTANIKSVQSETDSMTTQPDSLGNIPDYLKKYKNRVSFEKYPESLEDRRTSLKKVEKIEKTETPKPRARRPQTPKFVTNLDKIQEEPESIGDGSESYTKFNSEINELKVLVEEAIKGLKDNCEESHKSLQEKVETLDMKLKKQYQMELELQTKTKTREIQNLIKKNEALNTSLKFKSDENQKLKRELLAFKQKQNLSETTSNRT